MLCDMAGSDLTRIFIQIQTDIILFLKTRVTTAVSYSRVTLCAEWLFARALRQGVYCTHMSLLPTPKQIMRRFNRAGKGKGKLMCGAISPVYFLASLKFIMRQLCWKRSMLVSVLVQVKQGQCGLTVPRPSAAVTQASSSNPNCFHRLGIDPVDLDNAHNFIATLFVPSA